MAPKQPVTSRPSGELALIELIRARAAVAGRHSRAVRLGIGDDCAILATPPGQELLVTTDFSLEGRHFRRDWHPAAAVGHRALARGLSDLAAMGAQPLAAFLSLALPRSVARDRRWIEGFLDGLLALAEAHGFPLAGGDTSESPSTDTWSAAQPRSEARRGQAGRARASGEGPVLADIVLLGSAPAGRALRRSGARPGDLLFCTGALGGAAAELEALSALPRRYRRAHAGGDHPHLFPQPRLKVGQALLRRGLATACIDLSDGLSTDLAHLCEASSGNSDAQSKNSDASSVNSKLSRGKPSRAAVRHAVAAEVYASALPLHPLAAALPADRARDAALNGGEDYELLFTAPSTAPVPRSLAGVPLTAIGRIVRRRKGAPQVTIIDEDGRKSPLLPAGWEHLR